jgi:acetyltransferase
VARFAPEAPPAASEPAAAVAAEGDAVDEDTVKSWLEELGARTPARRVVGSRDEAVAAADAIGYPVVVKLLDTRVAHRAADGLVRLNLTAPEAVGAAVGAIEASATSAGLTGPLQFLIEEFVVSDGVEWIVGLTNDFQFGPVVVFGVGGILTEVVGDVALAPAPLSGEAATELMLRCRSYGRLRRSIAPAQHDAMRELLVAVAEFGDRRREDLAELDLNPVVLTARDEAVVLDGLARVRRSAHAADTWRAEPAQVSR